MQKKYKKNSEYVKKVAVGSIILLCIGSFVANIFFISQEHRDDGNVEYYLQSMMAFQRRVLMNLPEDSVPFYGDSMVQSLAVDAIEPNVVNFGIGHDTSENLKFRLSDDLRYRKFQRYIIAVGVNDLSRGRDSISVYRNIKDIGASLEFSSCNYIVSVIPIGKSRKSSLAINRKIESLNQRLAAYAGSANNVYFVDVASSFSDHNGYLKSDYDIGDGIHLNFKGNELFLSKLMMALDNSECSNT